LRGRSEGSLAYHAGAAFAVATSFLTVWTTIVRDDGTGIGFFLVIMAAGVGAFATWFRPAGMARTMLGVAVIQASFALAIATAPSTANLPDGGLRTLLFSGIFVLLWLLSAALFYACGQQARRGKTAGC
jgi:predicted membrane channel-forming protein YqfA (hemolysin III family)